MYLELTSVLDSLTDAQITSLILAIIFLGVLISTWWTMKALQKGVRTKVIAIPFGIVFFPFAIWGIYGIFSGNKDYFGLIIAILSPVIGYYGTYLKLDDIKILIEKQNLKLKSMTQKEKLIRNLAVYGFIVVIMLLGILLPFIFD